jgi:hypothetical protein
MQVGDLVKFVKGLRGLARHIGIVIGFNGSTPTIRWASGATTDEPSGLIEVVNDSR